MADRLKLNDLPQEEAREALLRCCGSSRWAQKMLDLQPFKSAAHLLAAARQAWKDLCREDFLEAFSRHPRIGGKDALRAKFSKTRRWSQSEQSRVGEASEGALDALAKGNADYEKRFGYIFIVCASGKSVEDMLGFLRARLSNSPEAELRIAAAEQAKITSLRLRKLLAG